MAFVESKAARLVGAGGRGIVLKTPWWVDSRSGKAALNQGGFFSERGREAQQHGFIMHNFDDGMDRMSTVLVRLFS